MRKTFNISDYPGKYVMHCNTEEKAKVFCEYLDSVGRRWIGGDSYSDHTNWCSSSNGTYYNFNNGVRGLSKALYKEKVYTTLEFDDFKFVHVVGRTDKQITVKNVIFNPPATIVLWSDGTKTVVKDYEIKPIACVHPDGTQDIRGGYLISGEWKENGLSCAFAKKAFGNEYFKAVKKYCE